MTLDRPDPMTTPREDAPLEPRTQAGRQLLRDMGLTSRVRSLYAKERRARLIRAILDIEYEAAAMREDQP